jgi:hypothetical protein
MIDLKGQWRYISVRSSPVRSSTNVSSLMCQQGYFSNMVNAIHTVKPPINGGLITQAEIKIFVLYLRLQKTSGSLIIADVLFKVQYLLKTHSWCVSFVCFK